MIQKILSNGLNNKNCKILVVGDVMLDRYWYGDTSRVSPEAPVPVVKLNAIENRIGGAGNVAANIASLGNKVDLLSLVGEDENADILTTLLIEKNITPHLVTVKEQPTITKLRILSNNQQLLRLDTEKQFQATPGSETYERLESKFLKLIESIKIVIFSDYAKGSLKNIQNLINIAKEKGLVVIVDPKLKDFSHYKNSNIITPNFAEFEDVVGKCQTEQDILEKANQLIAKFNIENLLITRGSKGLTLVDKKQAITIPATSNEVYDVTGAGDTIIATLATFINSNNDVLESTKIANLAAGISVSKVGTSTVHFDELHEKVKSKQTVNVPTGLIPEQEVINAIQTCKESGEKVVFVNGCFDILHYGHIRLFNRAKDLGDKLVVGLNSDESIKRLKGPNRPINNTKDRMELIANLKSVDWVVPFNENTPGNLVRKLKPNVLAKAGESFKTIEEIPEEEGAGYVIENGGEVHLIPRTEGCSSTDIINKAKVAELAT